MKKIFTLCCCFFIVTIGSTQTIPVSFAKTATSPRDTAVRTLLRKDLSRFLSHSGNETNPFIAPECKLETFILLDEMKDLRYSKQYKDSLFYDCEILNYIKVSDSNSIVQVAFTGAMQDTVLLRAMFTVYAIRHETSFQFYAPLKDQTVYWNKTTLSNVTVYHKRKLNKKNAQKYFNTIERYDAKLSAPKVAVSYYCCDHFTEALKLTGTDYKSDYNGYARNSMHANSKDHQLVVSGLYSSDFTSFDPHDLWHARLHNVLSTTLINRPVDEGTAYLYGGSWGLTWEDILQRFKTFAAVNPNADWYTLYNESQNFDSTFAYPLNVDFAINALLVKKIEQEKGFPAVIELLSCGNKQKDNQNYFTALEKITGIQPATFNASVWELIHSN
jgi:hypothetical protein